MKQAPVLIVGAGPAGLATALALAKAGTPVRIIDTLAEPTNQSRAAIVHARTLEMFERLGIVEEFLKIGVKVHGAAVYWHDGRLLTRPSLDNMPTAYSFMLGVDQCTTERILTGHLEKYGVKVDCGVELISLAQGDKNVTVSLKKRGKDVGKAFDYVIGADGARSLVRHKLGLHLEGETIDATWITADVKINWERGSGEAVVFTAPDGFVFMAPMNGDRWRLLVSTRQMSKEAAAKLTLQDVQNLINERFDIPTPLSDCAWMSPFSINTRMTPTMMKDRVFLVGDASHVHSPVGGQGMNTGIQDGLNLAWKLDLVIKGLAKPALLKSFDTERHGNAKNLLRMVGPATKMVNLRHPIPIEIRNTIMHAIYSMGLASAISRNFSMLNVGYPDSPVVGESVIPGPVSAITRAITHILPMDHAPKPGQRAPDTHALVDGVEKRLFEIWADDLRHQLLIFAADHPDAEDVVELREKFSKYPDFLRTIVLSTKETKDTILDENSDAHNAYGVRDLACYLIRPDGYIAFRSEPADIEAIGKYLKKWFRLEAK
jgi:2-polyprenyl-6-methoxyphenol hydroxylase-like FAD-dependent oxidoreductase